MSRPKKRDVYFERLLAAIGSATDFIKQHEGFKEEAYWDKFGKVWTVGYGQTQIVDPTTGEMRPVKEGDRVTEEDAAKFVDQRVRSIAADIHKKHKPWRNRLSANALAALYDVAYNAGVGVLSASNSPNLNRRLNDLTNANGDSIVWDELPTYKKSGGRVIQGLVNRRADALQTWGPYADPVFTEDFENTEATKQLETQQATEGGDTEGTTTEAPPPAPTPAQPNGPRIVINPAVFEDKRDALCVAFNEALRIVMEETDFEPMSEPTDKQREFFADTAYADNELQLRRTILARIATLDTSVKDPTDEQIEETMELLEMTMEIGAPQNEWEQSAVQRLHDFLGKMLEATQEERDAEEPADVNTTFEPNLAPADQNLV